MEITSNHTYRLPAPRAAVWRALAGIDAYPSWWPWLRQFEASALAEGDEWRCTIRPPLPYAIRCQVVLVGVWAPELVVAQVSGDIAGTARLELTDLAGPADVAGPADRLDRPGAPGPGVEPPDHGVERPPTGPAGATEARITSRLEARRLPARVLARLAPPVARWGHDWVFDTAARQFSAAGLGRPSGDRASRRRPADVSVWRRPR